MNNITTNERRLRIMHFGNILGAGLPGAVMILLPVWARANMFAGTQDPAMFGMTGAIWFAIGLGGVIGLFYPNLMKGVFLAQIIYKTIWIAAVALPLMLQGNLSVLPMVIFFALVVIGFGYGLFGESRQAIAMPAIE